MTQPQRVPEQVGRYAIYDPIAQGGMARVHLARLSGPEGFSRVVAVKRMHARVLQDPELRRMFVTEARLATRVRHPNVVPILDVVAHSNELMIVMDYVHGVSVRELLGAVHLLKGSIPLRIASAIMIGALQGLHAAHEALDEDGVPLNIVHQDVSPQNVLVGADGVARVLDFGVAKAVQFHEPSPELLKGKFSYMAPEVIRGTPATRQADIFSASIMFWEVLVCRRLFGGTQDDRLSAILAGNYPRPRTFNGTIPPGMERIVMQGLDPDPERRYASALQMASEIESEIPPASQRVVGTWVQGLVAERLSQRAELIRVIETSGLLTDATVPVRVTWSVAPVTRDPPPEPKPSDKRQRPRGWTVGAAAGILATACAFTVAWNRSRVNDQVMPSKATAVPATPQVEPLPSPPAPIPVPTAEDISEFEASAEPAPLVISADAPVVPVEAPVVPVEAPVVPVEAPVVAVKAPVVPVEAPVVPVEAPVVPIEAPVVPVEALVPEPLSAPRASVPSERAEDTTSPKSKRNSGYVKDFLPDAL